MSLTVHPLFDDLLGVMFVSPVEPPDKIATLQRWIDAGKPVVEEEVTPLCERHVWRFAADGFVSCLRCKAALRGDVINEAQAQFLGEIAKRDERIAELEKLRELHQRALDERAMRIAELEVKLAEAESIRMAGASGSVKEFLEIGKRYVDRAFKKGWDAAIDAAAEESARSPRSPEDWAHRFHVLYEQIAPTLGYRTRMDTRLWDPKSDNGRLMIAVVEAILPEMNDARERILALKKQP